MSLIILGINNADCFLNLHYGIGISNAQRVCILPYKDGERLGAESPSCC